MTHRSVRLPILPPVGPCRLSRWLVDVGTRLTQDQPYAEIEADKATMELRAPTDCCLVEQQVAEGAAVLEATIVAVLEVDEPDSSPFVPTLYYLRLGR
ncbi:MAG: lipoyl domain-containing protein [Myxococcales bacterium]|nr:lipoyl domain-containing protein [Myxococcales bacterium]